MKLKRILASVLAIAVMLLCLPVSVAEEDNLLRNASFEELDGMGLPVGWRTSAYRTEAGFTVYSVASDARTGENSIQVNNIGMNDARFEQTVRVEPNSLYCLSGYIKADEIPESGWGANLSVADVYISPASVYHSEGEWIYTEIYGETGPSQRELTVYARVGGFSGESQGRAQFDDLCLRKVKSAPLGASSEKWYRVSAPVQAVESSDSDKKTAAPFWPWLIVLSAVYLFIAFCVIPGLRKEQPWSSKKRGLPWTLVTGLSLAFVLRFVISVLVDGYQVDVGCFLSWGSTMAKNGPGQFYQSVSYCDYPPLYMYILGLNHMLQDGAQALFGGLLPGWLRPTFFVKLLPMLSDIGIAAMIYKMATTNSLNRQQGTVLSLLVAFNPVMIINSAAWCQVDSVLALLLLLVCWLAIQKRWAVLMPVYVVAVLVKPQALMVGPLGLLVIVMALVKEPKQWKSMLIGVGAAVVIALVLVLPFMFSANGVYLLNEDGEFWLTKLYANTLASYPYATVNTANLYYLVNGNWSKLENIAHWGAEVILALICILWAAWEFVLLRRGKKKLFLFEPAISVCFAIAFVVMAGIGVSWGVVGFTAMALAFAMVIPIMLRSEKVELLPLMGGVLFLLLYVLGAKMHERYLFPALALFAAGYVYKRDNRILWLMVLVSGTMFINEGIVLDNSIRLGSSMGHLNNDTQALNMILSILNVASVFLGLYIASTADEETVAIVEREEKSATAKKRFIPNYQKLPVDVRSFAPDASLHWKRLDTILVLIVTAIYSVLAFLNLGSTKAPQSMWAPTYMDDYVVIDLGQHYDNVAMLYYCAVSTSDFSVETSDDGESWSEPYWAEMKIGMCYSWHYMAPSNIDEDGVRKFARASRLSSVQRISGRYVRVTSQQIGLRLGELIFRDAEGKLIPAMLLYTSNEASGVNAQALLDEQDTITGEPSWYNSTYFDEIYHARTAKELVDSVSIYETTHPPLGKVIMSWFVSLFGMTPFGWRFAGTMMGVLMLPAIYLLAKQLTKKTAPAFAAMMMMTLDCMHFTQTRIATIDSFPVFFIIVSYFFMARFMQRDITKESVRRLLPDLALCGFFMGCGIASKWIGIYAAVGLAVLYFWTCARHVRLSVESIRLLHSGVKLTKDERAVLKFRADKTLRRLIVLCLWCVLFFIVVPAIIYLLSYIPHMAYRRPQSFAEFVKMVMDAQQSMFSYHSSPGLGMDHPYYSPWYEWIVIAKPMYYYSAKFMPTGYSQSIYCLGNPAVWYVGIAGLAMVCFAWAKRHTYTLDGSEDRVHAFAADWDIVPAFVLVGFLAQILPWVLVPRGTYIYHYFASIPFLILSVALLLHWVTQRYPRTGKIMLIVYLLICLIFFLIYYPYASGMPTPKWWLEIGKRMLNVYYSP